MIPEGSYTTKEIAEALSIARGSATRKLAGFRRRIEFLSRAWQREKHPQRRRADNIASAMIALIETGHRLAQRDPGRLKGLLAEIIKREIK